MISPRRRCLLLLAMLLLSTTAWSQGAVRVLQSIDVMRTTTHIDVVLLFNCHARYMTHAPSGEADSVRVRLTAGEDCGTVSASETLPIDAVADTVRALELTAFLGRDMEVIVQWRRSERFVVLPTGDQLGLRLRLLRPGREAAGSRVVISEPAGDLTTAYAINLDSAREPFDSSTVEAASTAFGMPAYVSQTTSDGVLWHRLRVGPIGSRADAERLLLLAQATYPRAWLAIADETVIEPPADSAARPAAATASRSAATSDPSLLAILTAGRTALRRKQYDASIELLTKYLSSSGPAQRAEARELLGLARERNGQLAHAKAEYEAFLREFPADEHAPRVRRRLQALRTAALAGRSGAGVGSPDDLGWRTFGGVSQSYRRDANEITNERVSANFIGQSAILTDADILVRRRGLDRDFAARLNAGFVKDLLADGPGDRIRVSSAFVELAGRDSGWSGRLGRQARNTGGVLGVFDGLYGHYQWLPHLTFDAAVGLPVESTREAPATDRSFEALSVGFGVFNDAWEPAFYVVNQSYDGQTDRQAVGAELRYFQPGRVLVSLVDYDVHFQALNSAVLIGSLQLPAHWMLNLDIERRNSPLLTTGNALIGQPVAGLDDLLDVFAENEVRQLALDRTSRIEVYGMTLSRPFAQRLQLSLNATSILTGATQPSGGVEGIPSTGRELVLSAQLLAASLMRTGDLTVLGIRRQTGGSIETSSIGVSSRIPLWGDWRVTPQLRVDRRLFSSDEATQWLYIPSLRLSLQKRRFLFDLEAGTELGSRESRAQQEDTTRHYLSVGYRWTFF